MEFHEGLPTPYLVQELNYSSTHIMTRELEDTIKYVVIHITTEYVHPNSLIDDFVCKVTLGDLQTHIYVVSVDSIVDSLNMSQNWGGVGNKFFIRLPYRDWETHFTRRIPANIEAEAGLGTLI